MAVSDVIIIGGGPAAYCAGLYTARFQMKHILFEGSEAGESPGRIWGVGYGVRDME